jgi:hypothetical protein
MLRKYISAKIITLELPKLPEAPDAQKVWSWAKFFRVKTRGELEAASAAAKGNRGLEMAVAEYKKLTWSERRQMIAEEKEKARRDKIAMLHYARNEGLALGRMQLAALLKSGKTLDEALAILQAETQDGEHGILLNARPRKSRGREEMRNPSPIPAYFPRLRACSNCGFLRSIDRKNPDFRALLEPAR